MASSCQILLVSLNEMHQIASELASDIGEYLGVPIADVAAVDKAREMIPESALVIFYYHGTWVVYPEQEESRAARAFAEEMRTFGVPWILLESSSGEPVDPSIGTSAMCRLRCEPQALDELAEQVRSTLNL